MIFSIIQASTQEKTELLKNEFKFSLVNFTVGNFQISYERYVKEDIGLQLNLGYTNVDNYNRREGVNAEFQLKYYLFEWLRRNSAQKIYFAPYAGYKNMNVDIDDYYWEEDNYIENIRSEHVQAINAGIVVGYKFILNRRLILDAYFGGGIRKANDIEEYWEDIFDPSYNGIAPRVGLDIGFNF